MFTPLEFLPHCRSLLCITVLIYISLEFKKVGIDQTVVPQVLLPMCMKTLTARWLIPWSYRISGACSQMLPVWKSKPNGKLFHRNYYQCQKVEITMSHLFRAFAVISAIIFTIPFISFFKWCLAISKRWAASHPIRSPSPLSPPYKNECGGRGRGLSAISTSKV